MNKSRIIVSGFAGIVAASVITINGLYNNLISLDKELFYSIDESKKIIEETHKVENILFGLKFKFKNNQLKLKQYDEKLEILIEYSDLLHYHAKSNLSHTEDLIKDVKSDLKYIPYFFVFKSYFNFYDKSKFEYRFGESSI